MKETKPSVEINPIKTDDILHQTTTEVNIPTQKLSAEPANPSIFKKHSKLFIFLFAFIVVYLAMLAVYVFNLISIKKRIAEEKVIAYPHITPSQTTNPLYPTRAPTPTPVDISGKFIDVDLGVVSWYEKPKSISVSDFINPELENYSSGDYMMYMTGGTKYLEVASTSNGHLLIVAFIPSSGMGVRDNTIMRFVKTDDGNVVYLYGKPMQQQYIYDSELLEMLLPDVKFTKQIIPGLEIPDTITSEDRKFQKIGDEYKMFSELKSPVKITETDYGIMYKVTETLWIDGLFRRKLYLLNKDSSLTRFTLKVDSITDDYKQNIMWTDGIESDDSFTQDFIGGCGGGYPFTPVLSKDSDFIKSAIEVGKDNNGNAALQVKDPNSSFVKTIYNEIYEVERDPSYTKDFLTLEEFANTRNHYLFQDGLGDWQLFIKQEYAPQAECAKPVIYLYPEKETEVIVKVGANVKKSEPLYTPNGWNVVAYPSGKLISNGVEYDYLFWDGRGLGEYPDYKNYGFLVEQNKLETTIRQHLAKLGLNEKESNDFIEYWLPLIPKSPYVRLTWLDTKDMNTLAPLLVYPKPDTVIRVFLEFEGLSEYKNLIPQKLTSIPRDGFTLIEWGGLLINVE